MSFDDVLKFLESADAVIAEVAPLVPGIGTAVGAGAVLAGKLLAIAEATNKAHVRLTGAPVDLSQHAPLQPLP